MSGYWQASALLLVAVLQKLSEAQYSHQYWYE